MMEVAIRCPKRGTACSRQINRVLREAPAGSRIVFEPGEYLIDEKLLLCDRKKLFLDGAGATLVLRNDRERNYRYSTDGMHVERCSDITIANFLIRAQYPSNTGYRVLEVTPEHVDIQCLSAFPLTGKEQFIATAMFGKSGRPLGLYWFSTPNQDGIRSVLADELTTTAPELVDTSHQPLGGNRFRIFHPRESAGRLRPGMHGTLLHTNYGLSCFVFRDCSGVTIESVEIQDFGGMGCVILPRCRDFTFRRFRCRTPDRERQPYSCTLDAIHTTGLGGKLLMENCSFEGVGDDILNTHAVPLHVVEKHGAELVLRLDKPGARFPERWGRGGDLLAVYDGENFRRKTPVVIHSITQDRLTVESSAGTDEVQVGDYLLNTAYCPEITVRNCVAVNCRSRFCLEAAKRAEFSGNYFDMCSFKAPIYISCSFRRWAEAGIVENISIHDNDLFCTRDPLDVETHREAVWVRIGEPEPERVRNRYRNIRIFHNRIRGEVAVSHTDGLAIEENWFDMAPEKAVRTEFCTQVRIEANLHRNPSEKSFLSLFSTI